MSRISTIKARLAKVWNGLTGPAGLSASASRVRSSVSASLVAAAVVTALAPSQASAETRTLKLYYVHTGEKAEITFKRDGRFLPDGLKKLNVFLRDWRRNEPTKMDPRLFDLVWQVYRSTGSNQYITVVSAYRSPATNNMLRSKTSGVAKRASIRSVVRWTFHSGRSTCEASWHRYALSDRWRRLLPAFRLAFHPHGRG